MKVAVVYGTLESRVSGNGQAKRTAGEWGGVGVLLQQYRAQTRVQATDAFLPSHGCESVPETAREAGLRDKADADGLERAEREVPGDFGQGRRPQVHGRAVLRRRLLPKHVDGTALEELVPPKLEGTLQEVSGNRGS